MKNNQIVEKIRKELNLNIPTSRIIDRNEITSLDYLIPTEREEIDLLMRNIDTKIEEIGKLCDKKKEKTFEDYKNVLKHNKHQLNEELARLKIKLNESSNMSTKDEMLNKIRKELKSIKLKVIEKDKELQENNSQLEKLENKITQLKEDKDFFNKEITNAKKYNSYLKNKLKQLEMNNSINDDDEERKNENSFYITNQKFKTSSEKILNQNPQKQEEEFTKLGMFIKRNEQILNNKIQKEEKGIKQKYSKLKALEKFNNPMLNILSRKQKEYELFYLKSRTTNQEVFFNVPENDLSGYSTSQHLRKSVSLSKIESNLNKFDKKEIVKRFLEDEEVKKFLYDALYKQAQ